MPYKAIDYRCYAVKIRKAETEMLIHLLRLGQVKCIYSYLVTVATCKTTNYSALLLCHHYLYTHTLSLNELIAANLTEMQLHFIAEGIACKANAKKKE